MIYNIPETMTTLEASRLINANSQVLLNSKHDQRLAQAKMLLNIYLQSALTAQLQKNMDSVKDHDRLIKSNEKLIAEISADYRQYRSWYKGEIFVPPCDCGAKHTHQNPVTLDPIFKKYICQDCQVAYELDE